MHYHSWVIGGAIWVVVGSLCVFLRLRSFLRAGEDAERESKEK
jgi:hypothetical protein